MNWFISIDGKLEDDAFYGNHKQLRAHMAEKLATITYAVAMSENGHTEHFEGLHRYEVEVEVVDDGSTIILARFDMWERDEAWEKFHTLADVVIYRETYGVEVRLVEVVEGQRLVAASSKLLAE